MIRNYVMPMEMEIYFIMAEWKNCKVEIFLQTIRVIFCFEHLKCSLLISFLKNCGATPPPSTPLAHYVSLGRYYTLDNYHSNHLFSEMGVCLYTAQLRCLMLIGLFKIVKKSKILKVESFLVITLHYFQISPGSLLKTMHTSLMHELPL